MIRALARGLFCTLLTMVLLVHSGGGDIFGSVPVAWAVEPDEMLKDPELEARARKLSQNLRCLVCQNETIDESNAPLARDLRILLRERLKAGDTDEEAVRYIVDRYGEYVLLKPRFGVHTLILWLGPFLALVLGLIAAAIYLRRRLQSAREALAMEAPLSEEEKRHLQELLEKDDGAT